MAETVIDQLVVKLGLDTTEFEAGEKKVASSLDETKKSTEKIGKNIAADGKKGAEFFSQLEKAAIKFFAVLTVGRGMADFASTVINTGAQLDRVSGRLGTSAETLSRWQGAVRQSGGTADGFLGTMQNISQAMTELQLTGNTGMLPFLQRLGVSVVDANGKAKSTVELLKDIGEAANAKVANPADRFNILRSMGIDEGSINLMMKGAAERDRLLAAQKEYSAEDAKSARIAQENWEAAQIRIERTTQKLVIDLIPAFESLTKSAEDLADVSVPMLRSVYGWFEKIDAITGKWSSKLDELLPKFKNPTMQKIFGFATSTAEKFSPAPTIAAAGASLRDEMSTEEKGTVDRARDKVLAFFGNKNAKRRLEHPYTEKGKDGGSGILDFFKLRSKDDEPESDSTPAAAPIGASRAERNNNPGNLEYRGQQGAVPEDGSGRFAKFGSPAEGSAALVRQLQLYGQRGINTLEKIISKYAPPGENDTQGYIDALSKKLGVSPREELDLNNADTLSGLVKGIGRQESGKDFLSNQDVLTGLKLAGVNDAQRAPSGSQQQSGSVSIGEVKVYTQATDANGIARDMRGAIIRQADTGIQ